MSKQSNAVDSPMSVEAARAEVRKAATAWKRFENSTYKGEGTATIVVVKATLDAMRSGYLRDGRVKDPAPGTVSRSEFGRLFKSDRNPLGVSGGMVTYWQRLAGAVESGVTPGDGVWLALATTGKAAKRADVGKVCADPKSTVADIVKAMSEAGLDPVTGKRKPGETKPRKGKDAPDKDASDEEAAVAPFDAAKDACKVIREACKSPTIQAAEWEAIKGLLASIITSEDRKRGVGTKRTTKAA